MTTKVMKRLMKLEGIQCPACVETGVGLYVHDHLTRLLNRDIPVVIKTMVRDKVVTPYHGAILNKNIKDYREFMDIYRGY